MVEQKKTKTNKAYFSPWMIVGVVTILLVIVVVLSIRNINREKGHMSQILNEKGAALIKAFEAGTRTAMMGKMEGAQIQNLLEETARQSDILYLAVISESGTILAHNDRTKIGEKFYHQKPVDLTFDYKENWRIKKDDNNQQAFEVYRYFKPLTRAEMLRQKKNVMTNCPSGKAGRCTPDWCFAMNPEKDRQVIFIGFDPIPFQEAREEDIRNTIILSFVLVILGFGGFISLFWAHSYRTASRSLQDTSAFANEVVSNLPVGLIATNRDGNIAFFNSTAETITGIDIDSALGKKPETVLPDQWCGLKEYVDHGETIFELEMECAFSGKKPVPVSVSAARIINENDVFVGNILILRDLGEIRQLQEEIRRQEKLAALGGLAAGVAHEIRNPLSSIKGIASYFKDKFSVESGDRETADVMIREVDRLNRVISELLEFAKPSELELKSVDINYLLEHTKRLIQQDAKAKNIDINLSISHDLSPVQLDPDRFSQCLLNLYINAIQSIDDGGDLSVRSFLGNDETIKIEIEDTGSGIHPDDLKKIFDPYFTTKPSGTGLGLAIVHKIIEAHDFRIKAKSMPDQGTIFTILIPAKRGV